MKHTSTSLILTLSVAVLICALPARATDTIRVCTYNALKFSQSNEDGRVPMFHLILDSLRPDIMVCQEVDDASMGPRFVTDVLTWAPFASSPFIDGPDTDNQLLYDQSKFTFISQRRIPTTLRDLAEFVVATIPENGVQPDTIVIYSMHLKASDGSSEAAQRASEINTLMSSISSQRYALLCGDLNMYGTNEAAYKAITGVSAVRRFIDPLGTTWVRNTAASAAIYTQCTRNVTLGACGGGVDGGLDDRFDYIFVSEALATRFVPASYKPFGNDGLPRLNASIDEPPNTLVSASMAAALKCASDHLPLSVDIVVGETPADVNEENVLAIVLSANPSSGRFLVSQRLAGTAISVYNMNGKQVYNTIVQSETIMIDLTAQPSGIYHLRCNEGVVQLSIVR
ncbi:MAG: T9SS type A sorting domain-containing protein [bacterium]|nr:T9SS type A sorting domain-containing protein [bacterium]